MENRDMAQPQETPHSSELDLSVYQDLRHIEDLWTKPDITNEDLRSVSNSLRRLLVYKELHLAANPRNMRIVFSAPQTDPLVKAARENSKLEFFQSAGVAVGGVWFGSAIVNEGGEPIPIPDYHPDRMIDLELEGFLQEKVFCFNGSFVTRGEVIEYVANKAGADKTLDQIRNAWTIKRDDKGPIFAFDLSNLKLPTNEFLIRSDGYIDPVLVEVLAACKFVSESQTVRDLATSLGADLGK